MESKIVAEMGAQFYLYIYRSGNVVLNLNISPSLWTAFSAWLFIIFRISLETQSHKKQSHRKLWRRSNHDLLLLQYTLKQCSDFFLEMYNVYFIPHWHRSNCRNLGSTWLTLQLRRSIYWIPNIESNHVNIIRLDQLHQKRICLRKFLALVARSSSLTRTS